MQIKEIHKIQLTSCLEKANNFIILTTGRSGSDFLQSCYDLHPEVATTSEKSHDLASFIIEKQSLLPQSSDVFAAAIIEKLLYSFAPYLNKIENWPINKNDKYIRANVSLFLESLTYLLSLKKYNNNLLNIIRSVILSFSFSRGKDLKQIKSIIIHLHHFDQMIFYSKSLKRKDLIIVCSRNPHDLIASGVLHWRKYWSKSYNYSECNNLGHYRKVTTRALNDFLDVKKYIGSTSANIFLSDLAKLGNLEYLNEINRLLSIKFFKKYPSSTVLGIKRGGDLLSGEQKSSSYGVFNPSLVKRGSPYERLGFVDSIIISLIGSKRIKKYSFTTQNRLLDYLIKLKYLESFPIFILLLIVPTKFEILYFVESLPNFFRILKCNILTFKQKIKQIFYLLVYVGLYPLEFILMRLFRLKIFIRNHSNPSFIKELYF